MKKEIYAELKQLAQEILSNNDFSTEEMQEKTKTLYEKLTVLKFVEQNLNRSFSENEKIEEEEPEKPSAKQNTENLSFSAETLRRGILSPEEVTEREDDEAIIEPNTEKIKNIVSQMSENFRPTYKEETETVQVEEKPEKPQQTTQQDLGIDLDYMKMPEFEPKKPEPETERPKSAEPESSAKPPAKLPNLNDQPAHQPQSLNNKLRKGINIGLNDRIAFIKNLFDGSTADYNRVLSQVNTFNSEEEALDFIARMVKPDYNNWEGKEIYENRFLDIISARFK